MFTLTEWGLQPYVNLFYTAKVIYSGFISNINSPITLHFVWSRWHLSHGFQFAYNVNSAITFFMQSRRGAVIGANYVATLLVNSRG